MEIAAKEKMEDGDELMDQETINNELDNSIG